MMRELVTTKFSLRRDLVRFVPAARVAKRSRGWGLTTCELAGTLCTSGMFRTSELATYCQRLAKKLPDDD
jgi:hypothetical protein